MPGIESDDAVQEDADEPRVASMDVAVEDVRLPTEFLAESPSPQLIALFNSLNDGMSVQDLNLDHRHLSAILSYYSMPKGLAGSLARKCLELEELGSIPPRHISWIHIARLWKSLSWESIDNHERSFKLLKPSSRNYLAHIDLEEAIEDVLRSLPAFDFLVTSEPFMDRYVETVATRLFYAKASSMSPCMSYREFRKIDFVGQLDQLSSCETSLEVKVNRKNAIESPYLQQ
eukprot:jgi/Hompol1/2568/HPOL_002957-RA